MPAGFESVSQSVSFTPYYHQGIMKRSTQTKENRAASAIEAKCAFCSRSAVVWRSASVLKVQLHQKDTEITELAAKTTERELGERARPASRSPG